MRDSVTMLRRLSLAGCIHKIIPAHIDLQCIPWIMFTVHILFCFVVIRCRQIFAISYRVTSLVLGQSIWLYDCPSVCRVYLANMSKPVTWCRCGYNHNKTKHSKTVSDNTITLYPYNDGLVRKERNRPIFQIPQCTSPISHNTPFRTEMCTFLFGIVYCGIWERSIGVVVRLVSSWAWASSSHPYALTFLCTRTLGSLNFRS